jgi:hypothetical protein
MATIVQSSLVSQLVTRLPSPLLRVLDAWSQGVARRRWEQRQAKWRQRQQAAQAPAAPAPAAYKLRPWRD